MATLEQIKQPIAKEWNRFEQLFAETYETPDGLLQTALIHIQQRKGKQLRPIIVLLASKLIGKIEENSFFSAIALEILHTASLLHDDVVDCTNTRRGIPSLNAQFSNKTAILVGDYLLTRSIEHIAKTKNHDLTDCLSQLGKEITRGELLQLENAYKICDETNYFSIIRKKTAVLFALCAEAGAIASNATPAQRENLRLFGENLGICFQIKDDIFDYTHQAEIGKPTLNDLREGKFTLPMIYAMSQANLETKMKVLGIAKNNDFTENNCQFLYQIVETSGGLKYAKEKMEEYRQKAITCLADFENCEAKKALLNLLDYVLDRKI